MDGMNNVWRSATFDISSYSGVSGFKVRFVYGSHDSDGIFNGCGDCNDGDGWFVDDVLIQYTQGC